MCCWIYPSIPLNYKRDKVEKQMLSNNRGKIGIKSTNFGNVGILRLNLVYMNLSHDSRVFYSWCKVGSPKKKPTGRRHRGVWRCMVLVVPIKSCLPVSIINLQGSLYYQPKQCTIVREILKITVDLYCLIPPIWVI